MEDLLLTTINENSVNPSFLELYSLHQLTKAPASTIRHIISTLLPDAYQEYADNCYEVVNLAQLLLQVKVFWSTGSTVGEHLYGLAPATKSKKGIFQPLTSSEKKLCVLSMVLPFALLKLKETSVAFDHDDYDDDSSDESNGEHDLDAVPAKNKNNHRSILSQLASLSQQLQRLKLFFTRVVKRKKYSIALLSTLYNMSLRTQHLAYLFSLTSSFYPIHQYLGISLIKKKFLSQGARGESGTVATVTPQTSTRNHAVTVLFITAICFKIAEMLNRTDSRSHGDGESDDIDVASSPPDPPDVMKTLCEVPSDPLLCPLCGQPRQEPCASRGGYIFCYSCLSRSLSTHPYCPITGLRCAVEDIIRIKD